MNKASQAWQNLQSMDELSDISSPIHHLHPLTKFLAVIFYIVIVLSYSKYELTAVFTMILFPVLAYQFADIDIRLCFEKMKLILPLLLAVGIANPFLDKVPVINLGVFQLTSGMISMITLMLKGIFALMASFLLMSTTKIDDLCAGLRQLHVPELLVSLLLLSYRYISVIIEELSIMTDAYSLRAPNQKGIEFKAWGSFLGQLLLRSMDRAHELYESMQLRGYDGNFHHVSIKAIPLKEVIGLLVLFSILLIMRFINVAAMLGGMLL